MKPFVVIAVSQQKDDVQVLSYHFPSSPFLCPSVLYLMVNLFAGVLCSSQSIL